MGKRGGGIKREKEGHRDGWREIGRKERGGYLENIYDI